MRILEQFFYELSKFGSVPFYVLLSLIIIFMILKKRIPFHHSRWSQLIDGLEYSSQTFYEQLKKELHSHNIKNIKTEFVFHKEGGVGSRTRTYLRVKWKGNVYDICGAPFGNGFFVSWWLFQKSSIGELLIYKIPFIGKWLARKLFPVTYYTIDTTSMFMSYAQQSVLKVVDDISKANSIERLSETQRTPILQDFFNRKKR